MSLVDCHGVCGSPAPGPPDVWVGTVPPGGSCQHDTQCEPGNFCSGRADAVCGGACAPLLPNGTRPASGTPIASQGHACVPIPLGGDCRDDLDCAEGLCGVEGVCHARRAIGARCDGNDCVEGARCFDGACVSLAECE